jgi:nucleoside-diphosphate-sugar epimerase
MKIFVTGATGYIGGSVATRLADAGHDVLGLTRSERGAEALQAIGVTPHFGDLDDGASLRAGAADVDAVINAADADHAPAVDALIDALQGTGTRLIHTSGSSIVGDRAEGRATDRVYDDQTPFEPLPDKRERVGIDRAVLAAADAGIHSTVICPSMIYGAGLGSKPDSIQVPWMIEQARTSGVSRHIGPGENIWSNIHIEDLVDLYTRALEHAPAGSFFFAANGECSLKAIAEAIGRMLDVPVGSWSVHDAEAVWGFEAAHFAFGSNSRVRALNARELLGWEPRAIGLIEDIERCGQPQRQ